MHSLWVLDGLGSTTVWGIDAVRGTIAWNTTIAVNASEADYAYSYGVALSADGKWAIYDAGVVGVTNQTLYVVDSATGVPAWSNSVCTPGVARSAGVAAAMGTMMGEAAMGVGVPGMPAGV